MEKSTGCLLHSCGGVDHRSDRLGQTDQRTGVFLVQKALVLRRSVCDFRPQPRCIFKLSLRTELNACEPDTLLAYTIVYICIYFFFFQHPDYGERALIRRSVSQPVPFERIRLPQRDDALQRQVVRGRTRKHTILPALYGPGADPVLPVADGILVQLK